MRIVKWIGTSAMVLPAYAVLRCFPQPLFPYAAQDDHLVLHSDRPFSETAAQDVLRRVNQKLARSPLYVKEREHNIYICNSPWRRLLFFNKNYRVAGVAPYPFTSNVFLREARIEENRLISPSGKPIPGVRTLDYFAAHEVAHQLTGEALGPLRFLRLPQWVREGYADYVGKGGAFDYAEEREAFLAGAAEMDWSRSGLYREFHLLVAHALDGQGVDVMQLLLQPPSQTDMEAAVRSERH
jgi:hypothetical protein